MKRLKQHWSAPLLSALLSALMVLPVLCLFLFAAPEAQAQGLSSRQPTWAVLDFANPSGYGAGDVGRLASDSFVVELAKLNRYAILPRQDLLNGIQNENLTPPLNLTSIRRLGEGLGVDAIVAGEIASISFSRDHRQAKVNLVIRVIDPRSGKLLNGALAEGYSNPRPIPVTDEEQLINEAFGNAAFNAVRQISKFNLPVATVLIGRDTSSVTINKGTRDGMYNGLDMQVTRAGIVTGQIRITEATDNDSNALVTDQGIGIRPEDRATAIYHLPDYSIDHQTGTFKNVNTADVAVDTPSPGTHRNAFSGITGILVTLLAAFLLVSAVRAGHKDSSLGGAGLTGPHATMGRSSDLGGQLTSLPATVSIPAYIPVSVRITSDVGNINPNNFLEYHVYRSDSPVALSSPNAALAAGFNVTATTSSTTITSNTNNTGTGTTTVITSLGVNGFGQIPLFGQVTHSSLAVFDDINAKTSIICSKPDPTNSSTLISLSIVGTVATTTNTTGTTTSAATIPGTGLQFGQRVSYSVEGLYIQPSTFGSGTINPGTSTAGNGTTTNTNTNNNNNNNNTNTNTNTNTNNNTNNTGSTNPSGHEATYQLTGRRQTNTVTLIEPVEPSANAVTGTGLSNINVTVPATRGANDYIIQVSTDPSFTSKIASFSSVPGSYALTASAATPVAGSPVVFNNINLTAAFPNGTAFFYRIGARDPANGSSTGENPYVFSDPLSVVISNATGAIRSRKS